ncbi:YlxM family DNA-binding protein [Dialister micraerophilus]|uniref:YlxM family DNA-binding protein n=1 Tax=Dialister micraerophilus TaxID=309120 RepID=UPI0023F4BBB9|nr:sigma factor-like helix-turn-helix DNA-binding protein [Dialister micraerophilus]MDK8253408.1 sigma factor-like helix-turn-helix DNA-binding protein [Dialister micraerophilus]
MSLEKIVQKGELLDIYGKLLTKRQRECLELYYDENLTLAEIAEHFNISRQAVHDAMRHGEEQLYTYEKELNIVTKRKERQNNVEKLKILLSGKTDSRIETLLDFLSE